MYAGPVLGVTWVNDLPAMESSRSQRMLAWSKRNPILLELELLQWMCSLLARPRLGAAVAQAAPREGRA